MLTVDANPARADEGEVVTVRGERLRGFVESVRPGEGVIVRVGDGPSTSLPWSEVAFVFDGPDVVDADGNRTSMPYLPTEATGSTTSAPFVATDAGVTDPSVAPPAQPGGLGAPSVSVWPRLTLRTSRHPERYPAAVHAQVATFRRRRLLGVSLVSLGLGITVAYVVSIPARGPACDPDDEDCIDLSGLADAIVIPALSPLWIAGVSILGGARRLRSDISLQLQGVIQAHEGAVVLRGSF